MSTGSLYFSTSHTLLIMQTDKEVRTNHSGGIGALLDEPK